MSKRLEKFVCECCGHFFDSKRDAEEHERFIAEQKERDPLHDRLSDASYMLDTVQLRRVVEFAEGLSALREAAEGSVGKGKAQTPNLSPGTAKGEP